MTPRQLDMARAALEELQSLYQARLDHVAACVTLLDHLDSEGLPTPPTIGVPGWVDSLTAIGEGMDWMAALVEKNNSCVATAGLSAGGGQQGDPAPISQTPAPALKVAA